MYQFFGFTPSEGRMDHICDVINGISINSFVKGGVQIPSILTGFT